MGIAQQQLSPAGNEKERQQKGYLEQEKLLTGTLENKNNKRNKYACIKYVPTQDCAKCIGECSALSQSHLLEGIQ